MVMLITSIKQLRSKTTPEGFALFCKEEGIDPEKYVEPHEGICVDKMDLYRYGAVEEASNLNSSVKKIKKEMR